MAAISQPAQSSLPLHDHEPHRIPSHTKTNSSADVHARSQNTAGGRNPSYAANSAEYIGGHPTTSTNFRQHQLSASTSSASLGARNPKSGGLFAFAAAAIDKTIANISEPTIRSRPSASALSRLSVVLDSPTGSSENSSRIRSFSSNSSAPSTPFLSSPLSDTKRSSQSSLRDPISKPYSETDPNRPPPVLLSGQENKMHQTSSRLLRMTDDDRPFTRVSRKVLLAALYIVYFVVRTRAAALFLYIVAISTLTFS